MAPFLFINFEEFIVVGMLGFDKGYPWGCKCIPEISWYYENRFTYALSLLPVILFYSIYFWMAIRLTRKKLAFVALLLLPLTYALSKIGRWFIEIALNQYQV